MDDVVQEAQRQITVQITVPFSPTSDACLNAVKQFEDGAIAITAIISITMLIRSITNLVKAKAQ